MAKKRQPDSETDHRGNAEVGDDSFKVWSESYE